MGFFDGSDGGNFDPTNWIDHNVYEDIMEDEDEDDDYYDYEDEEEIEDDLEEDIDDDEDNYIVEDDEVEKTTSEDEEQYISFNLSGKVSFDNEDQDDDNEDESSAEEESNEISEDDKEFAEYCAKDNTNELFYTKILLNKFPELSEKYSIYKWDAPLFMIKDIAESNDFDNALKYLEYLIENVDYGFLMRRNLELLNRLSIDIVKYIISALVREEQGQYDHKIAEYLVNNKKLFDICFKYCDWHKWDSNGLRGTLQNYMRLYEKVNNVQQEKFVYKTFIEYQKSTLLDDDIAEFWYLFHKHNAMESEEIYEFYKSAISALGDKGKDAMFNLEYIKKYSDRIHIGFDRWYIGQIKK